MNRCVVDRLAVPAATICVWFLAVPLFVQAAQSSAAARSSAARTASQAKAWTPSRTPDGQPDLQGIWVNFDPTPFEKPLPDEVQRPRDPVISFTDRSPLVGRRDALVIDPPDG